MVVGVSGYGGAGKDSFFTAVEKLGYQRFAFADHLKKTASFMIGVPLHYWYDRDLKSKPLSQFGYDFSPDQAAIKVGTEVGRNLCADLWVRMAVKDLPKCAVFTDCRFPNEAQAIVDKGGIVVRINRPGVGPRIDMLTGKPHISDTALDDWPFDFTIDNNQTLEAFQSAAMHTVSAGERLLVSRGRGW